MSGSSPRGTPRTGRALRRILEVPGFVVVVVVSVLLALAVALPGGLALRNLQRMQEIDARIAETSRLQDITLRLQRSLIEELGGNVAVNLVMVDALRSSVNELARSELMVDRETAARFRQLDALLDRSDLLPRPTLLAGLELVRQILAEEAAGQAALLREVRRDAWRELQLTGALFAVFGALALVGAWFVPSRVVQPLRDLRDLLSVLAEGEFRRAETEEIHPLLVPLFENYNYLVTRLRELEAQHRGRARTLEREVRSATQALLEQHRTLANAERLAAVGETAAGVAHELRNPLAGVMMGLGNLRREVDDPAVEERLTLLSTELERVVRLLNEYLAASRHDPEPARPTDLAALVGDLLTLLQYQSPERIRLVSRVPEGLTCRLPRDRLRQVLLNLVLNAVEAMRDGDGEGEPAGGGTVTVGAERDGPAVVLSVCDGGPGFPPGMLDGPLQPFSTGRESGTGMGLVMVRRVVQDLDGSLTLENRPSGGACVHLRLPCADG